jgi:hypothetical protein
VTTPVGNDAWDLDRIRQLVSQNDLERGRLEYKRQLDNGRQALEAIAALANTFGGVVLIGVDEQQQGLNRLTGVAATERTRLVSMCWSQLTPPFSPEIIPVSLGHDDLYVLAVVINTDYVRRPVMLNQGNRIFVRLEDQNQAPDWYRLRDLFGEQAPAYQDARLSPAQEAGQYPDADLVITGRLLLTGPRSRPSQITSTSRTQTLTTLNSQNTAITGSGSSLAALMYQMLGSNTFDANAWQLAGHANTRRFSARWQGLDPNGRALTEARIRVEITSRPAAGDILLITLEAILADSRYPAGSPHPYAAEKRPGPFVGIGALHKLMLDVTTTLWGPVGETISTGILGQPLGPPALLDLTVSTTEAVSDHGDSINPPLDRVIDFGVAHLIPGNTPGAWTSLGPVQPDRATLGSPAAQGPTIHDWLIELGIENGYQNIEQEVSRWTGITTY